MIRTVDQEFQQKLDEWNRSHPGPADVAAAWNPRIERWEIWAIPTEMSSHERAHNDVTIKLMRPFPDNSSRVGIKLFVWADFNEKGQDVGYMALDNRVFDALHWADSFRSRRHFEETISDPEIEKEVKRKAHIRAVAAGTAQYWHTLDRPAVSMNPAVKVPADWRHRIR
jgi:hypothetical protein